MAQTNVPQWHVSNYKPARNGTGSTIPAHTCLVASASGDRYVKVPATSATVRDFAGVSPRAIADGEVGDVALAAGDVAVIKASGSVTKGDRVYMDTASGKEGWAKTYSSGTYFQIGIALHDAADGELLEVRLAPNQITA